MAVSALVDAHHFLEVDGVEEEKKDEEDGSEAGEEEEEKEAEHGEQAEQAEEGVTEEEEMVLEAPKNPFAVLLQPRSASASAGRDRAARRTRGRL